MRATSNVSSKLTKNGVPILITLKLMNGGIDLIISSMALCINGLDRCDMAFLRNMTKNGLSNHELSISVSVDKP